MDTVTTKQVKDEIIKIASEMPEHIAPTTRYFKDGIPQCIVGHALFRLGQDPARIEEIEGKDSEEWRCMAQNIVVDPEHSDNNWITDVQEWQDCCSTWAEAVEKADRDGVKLTPKGEI